MTRFSDDPVYADLLFRQPRRHGKWRPVQPPALRVPVADTHAHVQLLPNPALALARAGAYGVGFICTIVDVWEDGDATFRNLDAWRAEAALLLPQLAAEAEGQMPDDGAFQEWPGFYGADLLSGDGGTAADLARTVGARVLASDATALVPRLRIAVGCHPHNASHYDSGLEALLRQRLQDPRVAALGEVGLDYHYDLSPRDVQREVFRRQIAIAHEMSLPLVLHMREAHDDGFAILEEEGFPEAGVLLHCFNLDSNEVRRWVDKSCYVAFGGPLTFKGADEVRQAAAEVPWNRLLTETDSPYMTPEPMRGLACDPAHTIFTAEMLCRAQGLDPSSPQGEGFLDLVYANALGLLDRSRSHDLMA